ncbi:hypothetical protein HPC37_10570 [Pasteurellaceae bacterium 20609_3]|uniref:hypothetical protein n=1 Tax=Spirabiliibacterium mucosae TaxID=28156 RepID=UPI001AAD4E47|nr:hypothetical protein [Spirabiliibacterium mucosae]MBE2899192.1 hypothetical protein [Spirabiliibacterium mucosae]
MQKTTAHQGEKIKKDKNESFIFYGADKRPYEQFPDGTALCIADQIPFEIPESWSWCRIRDITESYIGLTYSPKDVVKEEGKIVLRSSNIQNGKICLQNIVRVNKDLPEN